MRCEETARTYFAWSVFTSSASKTYPFNTHLSQFLQETLKVMKQAILTLKKVKRSAVGEVRVEGDLSSEDQRNMLLEGWTKDGQTLVFQIKKDLDKVSENQTVVGVVDGLWQMATVYDITSWCADTEDVLYFARPHLATLLRSEVNGNDQS